MLKKLNLLFIFAFAGLLVISCESEEILVVTQSEEIMFGDKIDALILENPDTYPIVDEGVNPNPYLYIRQQILSSILASEAVLLDSVYNYADKIRIIDDDALSAFTTPAGHIYIYNGLIQFLPYEDQLAGLLALEIAHAERRHISQNVIRAAGLTTLELKEYIRNPDPDPALETRIITAFGSMVFSKVDEFEADIFALRYLADSKYQCTGHARFFEELLNAQTESFTPPYLISHRADTSRIDLIDSLATKNAVYQCDPTPLAPSSYAFLKSSLN